MITDYFKIAVKNLKQRGLRSWLTMLGIFISIATIFTLVSLSLGLENAVEEQFEVIGIDKFFIMPATGFLGPPGSVGGTILTEEDVEFIGRVRGVKDYSYMVFASARVEFRDEIKYFSVMGLPTDNIDIFMNMDEYSVEEGSWLDSNDKNKILLGNLHKQEGKIFKRKTQLRDNYEINNQEFKVKGFMESVGNSEDDSAIFMKLDEFRNLFNISERVDYIIVQIDSGENITEVSERVEKKLRTFRGVDEKTQDFMISTPEELLESFKNILNIVTYFLAGVAAISLLVGAIGIVNTMYTSVLERTREIGVMKAIGARNSDILYLFMIESSLLGLVGAAIGVIIGFGISKGIELIAISQFNTTLLKAAAPLYLVVGCLLFGLIIGGISGMLPARQAAKTNVVDALRYE